MAYSPRFIIIGGTEIKKAQWDVLDLLEPGWLILDRGAFHYNTRNALVNKGWIEVRLYETHMMARLTLAGREIRDRIHIRQAHREERRLELARLAKRRQERSK
jgi:hypothetical protein